MSNTATVQEFTKNQSGRTKVKLDGQWYNVGNGVDLGPDSVPVGTRISFDSSSSDFNGKAVWWLNKYSKLPPSSNGVHADPAPHPTHPYVAPTTSGGSRDEPDLTITVSGVLKSLCEAKTITDPSQLDIWAAAIRSALLGKSQKDDFDDQF